jgi:hypothetical protein
MTASRFVMTRYRRIPHEMSNEEGGGEQGVLRRRGSPSAWSQRATSNEQRATSNEQRAPGLTEHDSASALGEQDALGQTERCRGRTARSSVLGD